MKNGVTYDYLNGIARLYNVVDNVFVTNIGDQGTVVNQALTFTFPIQITIIAIGVGIDVGLNVLLSKSLWEKGRKKINKIASNGIFLNICICLVFLLFDLLGSKCFISTFKDNKEIIEIGTIYLKYILAYH